MTVDTTPTKSASLKEKRSRAVSIVDGGINPFAVASTVDEIEYCVAGIAGKYSGEINGEGRPHGNGTFVRDCGGRGGTPLTYVGTWRDGERIGDGGYYRHGRLVGNVVWD